ncbi:MAG: hypothetical protein CMO80_20420 [Verrucomicrobiales bacterium]|nr:hypothetical protein [Verrucomicrobiales bacterium]
MTAIPLAAFLLRCEEFRNQFILLRWIVFRVYHVELGHVFRDVALKLFGVVTNQLGAFALHRNGPLGKNVRR